MNITPRIQKELNDLTGFSQYIHTWDSIKFMNIIEKTIGLFFGNQRGKGAMVCAAGYIPRIMGSHPVPERNVLYFECANGHKFAPTRWLKGFQMRYPDGLCPTCAKPNRKEVKPHIRGSRVIRFAGDILPGGEDEGVKKKRRGGTKEIRSIQYPEFIKWCPPFLIKSFPTTREHILSLKDPYGGEDIQIEFVSYKQPVKDTRGHQRMSIWADELGAESFYDEQRPRLMIEKGDFIITYTVTEDTESTVLFDQIYDEAAVYYRSKTIVDDYYKGMLGEIVPQIERTKSTKSIAVMQSASDDNPILSTKQVEDYLMEYPDPKVQMMRRYCVWQQLSAKIFPQFRWGIHVQDMEKIFAERYGEMAGVN